MHVQAYKTVFPECKVWHVCVPCDKFIPSSHLVMFFDQTKILLRHQIFHPTCLNHGSSLGFKIKQVHIISQNCALKKMQDERKEVSQVKIRINGS